MGKRAGAKEPGAAPGWRECGLDHGGDGWWLARAARGHLGSPCMPSDPVSALPPRRNGYQKFSQELLSNGELNHLPLKERMVEIGSRWQRISQGQKDHYKKLAEEQQKQYKVHLDIWLKVRAEPRCLLGGHWGSVVLGDAWRALCSQPSSGNRRLPDPFLAFCNLKGL